MTIAKRPSLRGTGWRELVALICPTAKAKYFSQTGWTTHPDGQVVPRVADDVGAVKFSPGAEPFSVLIDSILHRQATLQSAKEPFPLLPVETGLRGDLAMVVGMPLGRYFVFVGSLLLAFLFLADRYMPKPVTAPAHADIDRSIIRLHSSHKWPERIVIDTSLPTIVPPPTNTAEISPPRARSPKDAFALATPEATPIVQKAVHQKRRARITRTAVGRIASSDTIGYRAALPAGW